MPNGESDRLLRQSTSVLSVFGPAMIPDAMDMSVCRGKQRFRRLDRQGRCALFHVLESVMIPDGDAAAREFAEHRITRIATRNDAGVGSAPHKREEREFFDSRRRGSQPELDRSWHQP